MTLKGQISASATDAKQPVATSTPCVWIRREGGWDENALFLANMKGIATSVPAQEIHHRLLI